MKNNIKFNNSNILYTFSSVNSKYTVELTYDFINQYQLNQFTILILLMTNGNNLNIRIIS